MPRRDRRGSKCRRREKRPTCARLPRPTLTPQAAASRRNHTTSGLRAAPHDGQTGGDSVSSYSSTSMPSTEHFVRRMLPCNSITSRLPALWCRSSTFCVTRVRSGTSSRIREIARCPGLGRASATSLRRHAYQSQTRLGSLSKASGVASSCGSKRAQSPVWASLKVGTPLSAEIPEPVSTTVRVDPRRAEIRSLGNSTNTQPETARRRAFAPSATGTACSSPDDMSRSVQTPCASSSSPSMAAYEAPARSACLNWARMPRPA